VAQEHLNSAAALQDGIGSWPAQLHLARAATLLATGDEFAAVESSLVQYGQSLPGGDIVGQATRWINMAVLQIRRGQVCGFEGREDEANRLYADALGTLVQALGIAEHADDVHAQAHSRELLALVHWYLGRAYDAAANWEESVQLYERAGDTMGQARCQVHQAAALPEQRHGEAARLLRSALPRLPTTGVSTALARLHLARAEPRNAQRHREKGLEALAPWDGIAEPLQVTEIRRRLRNLPSIDSPVSGTPHDPA
jgi:tetratricopeptide (TPR) repeat protein